MPLNRRPGCRKSVGNCRKPCSGICRIGPQPLSLSLVGQLQQAWVASRRTPAGRGGVGYGYMCRTWYGDQSALMGLQIICTEYGNPPRMRARTRMLLVLSFNLPILVALRTYSAGLPCEETLASPSVAGSSVTKDWACFAPLIGLCAATGGSVGVTSLVDPTVDPFCLAPATWRDVEGVPFC